MNNISAASDFFKREKEISRQLEFEGMWIAEQPNDDNLRSQWDRLVLASPTFPQMYWDKFVKTKVSLSLSLSLITKIRILYMHSITSVNQYYIGV